MSEQEVNESLLEQEFNTTTTENEDALQEIRDMRQQLMEITANTPDPDEILMSNINRANDLLDSAQRAIESGGDKVARMYEVCGQLINAITSAATSMQNNVFGMQKHEYNMKMIEVKEKELLVKQAIAHGKIEGAKKGGTTVVAMSREELLRMIEKEETTVQVDSVNPEE